MEMAHQGNRCASTHKIVSLSARSVHLRQQHFLVQPCRLSRAAGKWCRKHAWNARSRQRHVSDAKQVLLWKGWVLKQRLNDVQSRFGAAATRAQVESPLRTKILVDSCSVRHQGNCCASTREIPATWISTRTQGTHRRSCDKTAALARHKHTWISLRAQRDMFRRKDCCVLTPRAHLDRCCACTDLFEYDATARLSSQPFWHRQWSLAFQVLSAPAPWTRLL